jgi:hypothetical protein
VCNPIQTALDSGTSYLWLRLEAGEYFNKGYSGTVPPTGYNNGALAKIEDKDHIIVEALEVGVEASRPKLLFDGTGGIVVRRTTFLTIRGLSVEGPSDRITGHEASLDRQRQTGRNVVTGVLSGVCSEAECGSCEDESSCTSETWCKWTSSAASCSAKPKGYYGGNGITFWASAPESNNVLVEDTVVSKCPGSGIRANKVDDVTIQNNLVFDNCWWTFSASSGVVFAEALGTGTNKIAGNVVYGNRNFMPFFYEDLSNLEGSHEANDGYSTYNASYIIDGSGVYITRNQNYQGTMVLTDNVAFDNGINGLVVHKTNNAEVNVVVERNVIFGNGRTDVEIEGRQQAGGLVVNQGPESSGQLTFVDNVVYTDSADDVCFQAFGTCLIDADSVNNVKCVGKSASSYPDSMFDLDVDCGALAVLDMDVVRAMYPTSTQPQSVPQYSFFPGHLPTVVPTAAPSAAPSVAPSAEAGFCDVKYGDDGPLAEGKTWTYYTYGCSNQVNGNCLADESYCDTSVNSWLPGSQGWCGENALGLSCGCCAPFTAGVYCGCFF